MSTPVWHYSRDPYMMGTACGRRVIDIAIVTSEPRDATCKKCVASAEMMGEL